MKALFLYFPENVRQGRPNQVNGWRFISTLKSDTEAFDYINLFEEIFPVDENPTENVILDGNGRVVYDPMHSDRYEFGYYTYYIEVVRDLDEYNDAHKIQAMISSDPWNLAEIKAVLGIKSEACAYALDLVSEGLEQHEVYLNTMERFPDVSRQELSQEISNYVMWVHIQNA